MVSHVDRFAHELVLTKAWIAPDPDQEMIDAGIELASAEGIFAAPEGGACVAALKKLLANGFLKPEERIVIYNTGSGLKYLEAYSPRFPR